MGCLCRGQHCGRPGVERRRCCSCRRVPVFSMVIGELVPKNFALAVPRQTAKVVVPFQVAFTAVVPAAGRRPERHGQPDHPVARHRAEGGALQRALRRRADLPVRHSAQAEALLEEHDATLLDRTLRFSALDAADVITPRVRMTSVTVHASAADVVATSLASGHSRMPVVDDWPDLHRRRGPREAGVDRRAGRACHDAGHRPDGQARPGSRVDGRRRAALAAARRGPRSSPGVGHRRARRYGGHRHPGGPRRGDRRRGASRTSSTAPGRTSYGAAGRSCANASLRPDELLDRAEVLLPGLEVPDGVLHVQGDHGLLLHRTDC